MTNSHKLLNKAYECKLADLKHLLREIGLAIKKIVSISSLPHI